MTLMFTQQNFTSHKYNSIFYKMGSVGQFSGYLWWLWCSCN